MSIENSDEVRSSLDTESAKKELREKVEFILKIAGVEDLEMDFDDVIPLRENLWNYHELINTINFSVEDFHFFNFYRLFQGSKLNDNDKALFSYIFSLLLNVKLEHYFRKQFENYKPNKTNKEKFEAKQKLRTAIKERFMNANLELNSENLSSIVDSSSQLIEDVISLPIKDREKAYSIGEKRVLSVFNPPGKSMGAAGNH